MGEVAKGNVLIDGLEFVDHGREYEWRKLEGQPAEFVKPFRVKVYRIPTPEFRIIANRYARKRTEAGKSPSRLAAVDAENDDRLSDALIVDWEGFTYDAFCWAVLARYRPTREGWDKLAGADGSLGYLDGDGNPRKELARFIWKNCVPDNFSNQILEAARQTAEQKEEEEEEGNE